MKSLNTTINQDDNLTAPLPPKNHTTTHHPSPSYVQHYHPSSPLLPPIGSHRRHTLPLTSTPSPKTTIASIPSSFYCPLTLSIMRDPVIDTEGYSYERAAIQEWLSRASRSPITRKSMRTGDLIPNRYLKDAIAEYRGRRGGGHECEEKRGARRGGKGAPPSAVKQKEQLSPQDSFTTPAGKKLRFDNDGMASFSFKNLRIHVEIPPLSRQFDTVDGEGLEFWVVTELPPFWNEDAGDIPASLYKYILKLNYMQADTRGGCLSLDPVRETIIFCYTGRLVEGGSGIMGTSDDYFRGVLEDFIDTAVSLQDDLKRFYFNGGDGRSRASFINVTKKRADGNHTGLSQKRSSIDHHQYSNRNITSRSSFTNYDHDINTPTSVFDKLARRNNDNTNCCKNLKSDYFDCDSDDDVSCLKKMAQRKTPCDVPVTKLSSPPSTRAMNEPSDNGDGHWQKYQSCHRHKGAAMAHRKPIGADVQHSAAESRKCDTVTSFSKNDVTKTTAVLKKLAHRQKRHASKRNYYDASTTNDNEFSVIPSKKRALGSAATVTPPLRRTIGTRNVCTRMKGETEGMDVETTTVDYHLEKR